MPGRCGAELKETNMKSLCRLAFPAATLAVLSAASSAIAEEPTVESLARPKSEIEAGVGGVAEDARRFGMYNGMRETGIYPMLEGILNNRNDDTGTWLRLEGRNWGVEGGRFRFEHEKQGDWNYFLEGSRTTFSNPKIFDSRINGLGSTQNSIGGLATDTELDMRRDNAKIGAGKTLGDNFEVDFSARTERKSGRRQWGAMGVAVAGPLQTFNFAAEPIDYTTQEYQGTVSYTGKQLQMQGGYFGSLFGNDNKVLNTVSGQEPQLSLPLDNMMHQLFLNGGYSFSPSTRGTFNASYGRTFQNEDFFTRPTFPGNTRSDLGGEVDNMLLGLGLTSRATENLTSRVKLRYEERNDNTPLAQYVAAGGTRTGYNVPFSRSTATADAEADYRLPMNFTLTGGIGYEHWERSSPPVRHIGFRRETDEVNARLNLRRPLLETLSGSIGYSHSERFGSSSQGVTQNQTPAIVDSILWADRRRDKGRATLDWAPTDRYSMQLVGEAAIDRYTSNQYGPHDGSYFLVSLDGNYKLGDDWDLTGWVSFSETALDQQTRSGTTLPWEADLSQFGYAVGLALKGQVTERFKLITDLQFSEDTSEHGISPLGLVGTGPSLPDIVYRQWQLGLTGDYAIQEHYGVKLRYGIAFVEARDWSWQGFTYADGSAVRIPSQEIAHFVGASLYFRW
jgi:MtrB/PioB family decaheme-associated outer membrane protein